MKKDSRAFSLLEIIIAIAISAVVIGLGGTVFYDMANRQTLDKDATTVLSYIEKARMLTINSASRNTYGIKFASSSVTVFPGTVYSSVNASNTKYTLSGRSVVSGVSLSNATTTFYFERLTGEPSATGTVTLKLSGGATTKVIIINAAGLADVQ